MLFHSFEFILGFLPATIILFYLLLAAAPRLALPFLIGASLAFYGWWDWRYLFLLLASILINFAIGQRIFTWRTVQPSRARLWFTLGIGLDLACIAVFKYLDFAIANVNAVTGAAWTLPGIILPLGISFFTFQKIAWLVDLERGHLRERPRLADYLFLVSFFPQLIAGPIVHHSELVPQVQRAAAEPVRLALAWASNLSLGLSIFVIGLFKKICIADPCALIASPIFAAADAGQAITTGQAWAAALGYSCQIYFDFSGYSDMAIGLAAMFGFRLPANFNSPYQATSLIEFWRRWHITLSRFLRDYVYVPLGGNRHGTGRRYLYLLLTMLIGGLWHGAAWTFVIWGALHGLGLAANHLWRAQVAARPQLARLISPPVAWALTMAFVLHGWVFFRATTTSGAVNLIGALYGGAERALPSLAHGPSLWPLALAAAIACLLPNTLWWFRAQHPASFERGGPAPAVLFERLRHGLREVWWLAWQPSTRHAISSAVIFAAVLYSLTRANGYVEFIYFQF